MSKIAVIGSGSWGVALAMVLDRNGHEVKLWSYNKDEAELINNEHKCKFLPNIIVPSSIKCFTDLEESIKDTEIILIVTPSKAIRSTLNNMKPFVTKNQSFVLCSKGMEPDTQMVYTQVIKEIMPDNIVSALSGPSHAEEVSTNIPTALVIASESDEMALNLQDIFMNDKLRVYTNDDMLGVEMGGSLKNIIALACGIAMGLGYGDNTIAALITRGIAEIARLGVEAGAKRETFYGLTGVGDLFVTCSSKHSRNRQAGILIGQGKSVDEAVKEVGMVVEGIYAVDGAYALARKYSVGTPIIDVMYAIIHNGKSPIEATAELMTRGRKKEF